MHAIAQADAGTCPLWARLRRLAVGRAVAVAGVAAALGIAYAIPGLRLPVAALAGIVLALALADALTFFRLRLPAAVTEREIFLQLVLDGAALTCLLYLTGGAPAPFAGGYIVLLLVCAGSTTARLTWAFAGICVACYTALDMTEVVNPQNRVAGEKPAASEGRWLFIVLVALAAWFAVHLDQVRRTQQALLAGHREKEARESYLMALATLSAGTAHEMSTPLSTMSVLVGDLRRNATPPTDWKQSIDVLWAQLQVCKRSLLTMARAADVERLGKVYRVPARQFIDDLCSRFRLLRPGVPLKARRVRIDAALALDSDHTLQQALFNFLGNAADASPQSVELRAGPKGAVFAVQILDRGPGIDPRLRERLGRGAITTKAPGSGMGAGLLIAHAAIERFGGRVRIFDRPGGGTCVQIELPAHDTMEEASDGRGLRFAAR